MAQIREILLTIVHGLTYLDLIAKVAKRVAGKFVPGWMVDIGYYALLGIDFVATLIDNKYKRTYDEMKKPITLEKLKEEDPFKVKRHYRRSRTLKGVFQRAKVDWLKKHQPDKVMEEIERIKNERND